LKAFVYCNKHASGLKKLYSQLLPEVQVSEHITCIDSYS